MAEIGVRAHDLGLSDARGLGKLARSRGFGLLQLAPVKALADCPRPPERIGRAWAEEVRRDLALSRVEVAVLGCYVDICGPGGAERSSAIAALANSIDVAPYLGAPVVATETPLSGGDRADCLARLRSALGLLLPLAESKRVYLCLEPVWGHAVDSPAAMRELVGDLASPAFGLILDPVNLVDPASGSLPAAPALACLGLLGGAIRAVHVKDAAIEEGRKKTVRIGSGIMDWRGLAPEIAAAAPGAAFIIEDQDAQGMAAGLSLLGNLP